MVFLREKFLVNNALKREREVGYKTFQPLFPIECTILIQKNLSPLLKSVQCAFHSEYEIYPCRKHPESHKISCALNSIAHSCVRETLSEKFSMCTFSLNYLPLNMKFYH